MRRLTITVSLALGLTAAALVLTVGVGARPYNPPGDPTVTIAPAPCPTTSTSATVVPGGVYRAVLSELRQQGASRAQIQAETRDTLVVSGSGARLTEAARRCIGKP